MYSQRVSSSAAASNRYVVATSSDSFGNIGGPTPTTPTLTPTTLKNIEESFMELSGGIPPAPLEHQHQAGFVPPIVNITTAYAAMQTANTNSNGSQSEQDYATDDMETDDSSSQSAWLDCTANNSSNSSLDYNGNKGNAMNGRKGTSGRKPKNDKVTPEEEQKRVQRRERNKQAAARCRKRRLDHTNSLMRETDGLEDRKSALLSEIERLKVQKQELEFILHTHKSNCKLAAKQAENMDIKPIVCNGSVITVATNLSSKSRPNSLPITSVYAINRDYKNNNMTEAGIPIQTPSNGLFLDALMESGTGLTPILNSISGVITPSSLTLTPSNANMTSTTCGSQQRSSSTPSREISSPDSVKLVPL